MKNITAKVFFLGNRPFPTLSADARSQHGSASHCSRGVKQSDSSLIGDNVSIGKIRERRLAPESMVFLGSETSCVMSCNSTISILAHYVKQQVLLLREFEISSCIEEKDAPL